LQALTREWTFPNVSSIHTSPLLPSGMSSAISREIMSSLTATVDGSKSQGPEGESSSCQTFLEFLEVLSRT
jgi:hypothetical protein